MSPAIRNPVSDGSAFRRNPLAFLRSIDDGSGVLRFRAGLSEFFVLTEPESIHRVLVEEAARFGEGKWTLRGERVMGDCLITREGAPHRERRALLQPGFERARLEPRAERIVARALALDGEWQDGRAVEMREQMAQLALGAAADMLFSLQLDERSDELVPALMTMLSEIPRPGPPLRSGRRLRSARRTVDHGLAALAHGNGGGPDALVPLGDEPGAGPGGEAARDELVSLLIAAIDTTPGTLAWCWYLLARHPAVEADLHAELDQHLGGHPPEPGDLRGLAGLDSILDEVLRLYPPVHFIDRRPLEDVEVDGVAIPAGSYVLLSPLLTQRDPRFFSRPDEFDPARWDAGGERPRYSYFPFGGGPHTCIGMSLARMQLGLVIATLAQRWQPRPGPAFPARPTPNLGRFPMVLRSRG